jgi:superfamily II DNA or RNA helicase
MYERAPPPAKSPASTQISFECNALRYTATVSYFADGRLAEIFVNNSRAGSHSDSAAKDSAVPVRVASIQTLWTRAMRLDRMPLPPANLLVIDEAHHCPAVTYRKIIAEYPNAVLLGMTATPCRGDGRGLGGIFDVIVECPQVAELIETLPSLRPTRRRRPHERA